MSKKEQDFPKLIKDAINGLTIDVYKCPKLPKQTKTPDRTIVAQLSDMHYGSNIDKREMSGVNEFNWDIACRRTAYYMQQICQYKQDYRKTTDLVLVINGDVIAGMIHDRELVDLLSIQVVGAMTILSQAISIASNNFNRVYVYCTSGNHGRNVARHGSHNRAMSAKYDSYEYIIYRGLKEIFEGSNVSFTIPKSPFALFKIFGHSYFATHGDTVLQLGSPGTSINVKSLTNQINKLASSSLLKNNGKLAAVLYGHTHVPHVQVLDNGTVLVGNGALVGVDMYAQSLGILSCNPVQIMFEATEDFSVGDIRFIYLSTADKNETFDKLITVQGKDIK